MIEQFGNTKGVIIRGKSKKYRQVYEIYIQYTYIVGKYKIYLYEL
jgi:hypothetical protein